MSGETEEHVSGWTTDTLKDMLTSLMDERDIRYQQRFESQQQALQSALTANEKRLDALNELRSGVATKDQLDALASLITTNANRIEKIEANKTAGSAVWGLVAGAIGVIALIIGVVLSLVK